MPQAAQFVINDGSATPVAVTFTVEQSAVDGVTVYKDARKSTANLWPRIRQFFSPATGQRATYKVDTSLVFPLEGVRDGVPIALSAIRYELKEIIPDFATDQQRKDAYAFFTNALASNQLKPSVRDLDPQS